MSYPKPLRHSANQIKSVFPNLGKPQAEVRAAFRLGVAKAKSRPLYAVARSLTFLVIPDTVETRLRRFIANPRIDMEESRENLARSVIRALPRADRGIGTSANPLKTIEGLGMRCVMRVLKIVRVMEDETVFPFKSLTVEPGRSWRAKAKAFKNAGRIERRAERLPLSRT